MKKETFSTTEVAKLLGISRIAVFKKIKSGSLVAQKRGRNYVVRSEDAMEQLGKALGAAKKHTIEMVVERAIREYGETFKKLGRE